MPHCQPGDQATRGGDPGHISGDSSHREAELCGLWQTGQLSVQVSSLSSANVWHSVSQVRWIQSHISNLI